LHPHSLTLQLTSRHTGGGRPSHHPQITAFGGSESTENESWGRGYTRYARRTIKRMLAAISQRNKPRAMSSLSGNEPLAVHPPTCGSLIQIMQTHPALLSESLTYVAEQGDSPSRAEWYGPWIKHIMHAMGVPTESAEPTHLLLHLVLECV
jgi:hypothetical protein